MEPKVIITKALDYYLIHIQIGNHLDGDRRKECATECISHVNDGGTIDKDWLLSKNLFFIDVFNEYSEYLKNEIQNAIPNDEKISKLREEQTTINTLLKALKQHFGIE